MPRSLSLGISGTMLYNLYAVKCSLTGFTTKSARFLLLVSSAGIHACTRIPCAPDWRHVCVLHGDGVFKEHCFCMGAHLQVSPSIPFPPSFHYSFSVMSVCLLFPHVGSWFSFQDLPAMGVVSIWQLATNSGSSWMSQAPNI